MSARRSPAAFMVTLPRGDRRGSRAHWVVNAAIARWAGKPRGLSLRIGDRVFVVGWWQ